MTHPPQRRGEDLFRPARLGGLTRGNRVVMAPLTRNRAGPGNVPQPTNAEYYSQRASAGLIITEATQVSPQGVGYPGTPGIHSPEQVAGWKPVTEAVHVKGGRIFLPIWHVGRISHHSLQPEGAPPVAPSAIRPEGNAFACEGLQPFVTPRALQTRRTAGQRRAVPRGGDERAGGGLRRRGGARGQRLPAGPVPARRGQPVHRCLGRPGGEPGAAAAGGDPGGGACVGRGAGGGARVAGEPLQRHGRLRSPAHLRIRRPGPGARPLPAPTWPTVGSTARGPWRRSRTGPAPRARWRCATTWPRPTAPSPRKRGARASNSTPSTRWMRARTPASTPTSTA
jgi:hypothetical protein